MRRKLQTTFLTLILVLVFSSCSMFPGLAGRATLTPEQRYAEAVVTFNSIYETYLDEYDLATSEVQAKWKERIDPLMADASTALRTWGAALRQGLSPNVKEELFIHLKNVAWSALFDYGIVKVGG